MISVSGILTNPANERSSFVCTYADEFHDLGSFQTWLKRTGWQDCEDGNEGNPNGIHVEDLGNGRALVAGHSVSIRYLHSEIGTWGSLAPGEEDLSSAMAIWVENTSVALTLPCNCAGWLQHWERFKNSRASRCAAIGCTRTDVEGACVKRIPDHECYIVPLCSLHSRSVGYFPVRSSLVVQSATKQKTCVEKAVEA